MNNLYHVQDSQRPMYVVAESWYDVLNAWRRVVRDEKIYEPAGIALVAEGGDLLLSIPSEVINHPDTETVALLREENAALRRDRNLWKEKVLYWQKQRQAAEGLPKRPAVSARTDSQEVW